jgi:3-oxoadipate enol-lactonase
MPFTHRAETGLYWKLEGREGAPALVLLNSIGTDMDLWDPVLPLLRPHLALLRIDARGHGASGVAPGDWRLADLAQDVLAVADDAGLARFSVAGVSLGGMIGMELALLAPKRLERLALVCTSATMDSAAWADRIAVVRGQGMAAIADLAMGRFLSPAFKQARPEVYATIERQLLAMDPRGYAGCGTAIRDMDLAPRLSAIAAPTLVVSGELDISTPFAGHGEHLLAGIPGAAHVALPSAHLAPLEAPEALAAALLSFLGA